jgi:hypothetical protein
VGELKASTKNWKYRIGSQRPTPRSVPRGLLRTISRESMFVLDLFLHLKLSFGIILLVGQEL